VRRLAGAALALLLLTGCSGAGEDAPPDAAPTSSPAADADDLTAELLAPEPLEAVATTTGRLPYGTGGDVEVAVDVLEVRAGRDSTALRWRLRSAGAEQVDSYTNALSRDLLFDTRRVAVQVDGRLLRASTYDVPGGLGDLGCLCSRVPSKVGPDGKVLVALLPALPATARAVDVVVLPGSLVVEDVPVTRS
jgi:hypothetical protein